jgi:hypothetical protein
MDRVRRCVCRWWLCRRTVGRSVSDEDARGAGWTYCWIQDELFHAVEFTQQYVALAGDFRLFFGCRGEDRPKRRILVAQTSELSRRMVVLFEFLHPFLERRFLVFQAPYCHGYALIDARQAVCMTAELERKANDKIRNVRSFMEERTWLCSQAISSLPNGSI